MLQMRKSSNKLRCPASIPCCDSGVLDGSTMSTAWQMGGSPRTCCMDSLPLAPGLRFKDVCKRDMKSMGIGVDNWEDCADDRSSWRQAIWKGREKSETVLSQAAAERRARRKAPQSSASAGDSSTFKCNHCQRDCHSQVGLYSHTKKCSLSTT